jgi:4-hydroxybenzoate polyprenyltransferase
MTTGNLRLPMPLITTRMPASKLRSWLQLFRLPNVFTAAADVLMGYLFTHPSLEPFPVSMSLVAASCLLYTAGMVLNDVFDVEIDARERPQRPLPSGRIAVGTARWVGFELLVVGVGLAWLAGSFAGTLLPGGIATALAAAIVLYDRWLKHTPAGPLSMGACRFLNVLLGMSAAGTAWQPVHWLVAGGIGVYIAGVTWFARTEAEVSRRPHLALAVVVMAAGMSMLAAYPLLSSPADGPHSQPVFADPPQWYWLWVVLGLLIVARPLAAVADPTPARVQTAVKNAILSLIFLNAIVCFSVRGMIGALIILALLIPATILGRWIYST